MPRKIRTAKRSEPVSRPLGTRAQSRAASSAIANAAVQSRSTVAEEISQPPNALSALLETAVPAPPETTAATSSEIALIQSATRSPPAQAANQQSTEDVRAESPFREIPEKERENPAAVSGPTTIEIAAFTFSDPGIGDWAEHSAQHFRQNEQNPRSDKGEASRTPLATAPPLTRPQFFGRKRKPEPTKFVDDNLRWDLRGPPTEFTSPLIYFVAQTFFGWGIAVLRDPECVQTNAHLDDIPNPIAFDFGIEDPRIGNLIEISVCFQDLKGVSSRTRRTAARPPTLRDGHLSYSHVATEFSLADSRHFTSDELGLVFRSSRSNSNRLRMSLFCTSIGGAPVCPSWLSDPQIQNPSLNEYYKVEILTVQQDHIVLVCEAHVIGVLPHTYVCYDGIANAAHGIVFEKVGKPSDLATGGKFVYRCFLPTTQESNAIQRAKLLIPKTDQEITDQQHELQFMRAPAIRAATAERAKQEPSVSAKVKYLEILADGQLQAHAEKLDVAAFPTLFKAGNQVVIKTKDLLIGRFTVAGAPNEEGKFGLRFVRRRLTDENRSAIRSFQKTDEAQPFMQFEVQELRKKIDEAMPRGTPMSMVTATENGDEETRSLELLCKSLACPLDTANSCYERNAKQKDSLLALAQFLGDKEPNPPRRTNEKDLTEKAADEVNDQTTEAMRAYRRAVLEDKLLNVEQKETLFAAVQESAVVLQEAPAGTGKTHVISRLVKHATTLLPEQFNFVVLSCLTNESSQNLASAVRAAGVPVSAVWYVKSVTAHSSTLDSTGLPNTHDELGPIARARELISQQKSRELPTRVLASVLDTSEHPIVQFDPTQIALATLRANSTKTKILIGTTAVVRMVLRKIDVPVDLLVLDEAGQIATSEALSIIAASGFPVNRLLVTGDSRQILSYVPHARPELINYGLRSVLVTLRSASQTRVTTLSETFRFHPDLASVISDSLYDRKLRCAVSASDRAAISELKRHFEAPVILVDELGEEKRIEFSFTNSGQIATIIRLLNDTILRLPAVTTGQAEVVIITFYSAFATECRTALARHVKARIEVKTVDAFQGRQTDILVLATVRTTRNRTTEFALDDQRSTVALTRAKHGLFVVGSLEFLSGSDGAFNRFLKALDEQNKNEMDTREQEPSAGPSDE